MIKKSVVVSLCVISALGLITLLFMQQASFGKLPAGIRMERIQKSAHYKDGTFQNIQETLLLAKDASYFGMFTKFFGKGTDREPVKDLPSIKTDMKNLPAEKSVIVWFGHSSFLVSSGGRTILADPVFSIRPSPVQYAGSKSYPGTRVYNVNDLPDLDIVIISHDHYDHLDYNTIVEVKDKTKLFCVPLGVGEHLVHWGVDPDRILEFDWWESQSVLPDVEVICTPARHFSGRGFRRNKTLWASFVLDIAGKRFFIGGDSGYDDSFKKIGQKYGPFDFATLECGQYDPQWPDIHMMPEQTVQASLDLQAKVFLPVHWAKFTLALHPWKDPIVRATKHADIIDAAITTPMIGQPIILGEPFPASRWWED